MDGRGIAAAVKAEASRGRLNCTEAAAAAHSGEQGIVIIAPEAMLAVRPEAVPEVE